MDLSEFLFTVPHVLSSAECRSYIETCEAKGFEPALILTASGQERRGDIRSNSRVIIQSGEIANEWWSRLARAKIPVVNGRKPVGLNSQLRFYRYDRGEEFGLHQDGHNETADGERSFFTLMIYLNEGFQGGTTSFPSLGMSITPQTGLALLFRHEIEHEGSPVTAGRKYAVRTDVMYEAGGRA